MTPWAITIICKNNYFVQMTKTLCKTIIKYAIKQIKPQLNFGSLAITAKKIQTLAETCKPETLSRSWRGTLRALYMRLALEIRRSFHGSTASSERDKMASLAVFDFDRTIVDNDSDAVVIEKLREKQPPPEWEAENRDWTPFMSEIFEHAYSAGLRESDVLSAIASMRPTPGAVHMLRSLHDAGWHIVLLTDANSVFVHHWLATHQLEDCVTSVITNRAFWDQGRLYIEPCMRQTACARCPTNLCKSVALAQWCARRQYKNISYAGDGRNDYCPATNLPAHAIVFPRRGYPLDDLIKKTMASSAPHIKARVVPWDSCDTILEELLPA